MLSKYEIRECATLGTNFRDIYKDGILFAIEVSVEAANWIIENLHVLHGNISAPVEKFRRWEIEEEYYTFRHRND